VDLPREQTATVVSGDDHTRWFVEQVHPHDARLKAYLRGSFPAVRDVDDVVQESYLRVWRRQKARPIQSVRAFLFKVARHLALDLLRHEQRSPIAPVADITQVDVVAEVTAVAESACLTEETELLLSAIERLPGRCREIYILKKLHGLPQKEIARRLAISEQTVEVQIGRGNRRCEQFLREAGVIRGVV